MGRPAGHRVLVKQDDLSNVDEAYARAKRVGIHLVEDKREQAGVDSGTVVAIGPSAFKDFGGDKWCSVGDRIAFAKYSGKVVEDGGDKFIVLNDEDVVYVYGEQ